MQEVQHDNTQPVKNSSPEGTPTVILYARHPRPGAVKTRLARGIGAEAATAVYAHMLEHALAQLEPLSTRMRVVIDAAGENDVSLLRARAPWVANVRPQRAGDIGERMAQSFARAFDEGACFALLLGSDLPGFETSMLVDAVHALETHGAVFGPAQDGGYWLVGLRRTCADLFVEIPWDGQGVYEATLHRAARCGLSCAEVPTLKDIDTVTDLHSWCCTYPNRPLTHSFRSILSRTETTTIS
jgi:rSAM/selenodomain-associated transferase 1